MIFQTFFDARDAISYLQSMGVYDVVLPFLLIFAIVFAILEKTEIFGVNKTNINAIVAFIIGLLLVVQQDIVNTINLFLPKVSLILIVIVMFLLLISLVAGDKFKGLQKSMLSIAIVGIIIALFFALSPSDLLNIQDRDSLIKWGVLILGIVLVFGFILGGKDNAKPGLLSKLDKMFQEGLKP